MSKKYLITLLLFIISMSAICGTYLPYIYYIEGVPVFRHNRVNMLKMQPGLSMSATHRYSLEKDVFISYIELDYDSQLVGITPKLGDDIELFPTMYYSFDTYLANSFKAEFYSSLKQITEEVIKDKERPDAPGLIPDIVIDLPEMGLPRPIRRIMGDRGARLSLDGSQRLTLAGNMHSSDQVLTEQDRHRTSFDLEMRQDLNLRLKGTIGEKINVNVNHRSSPDDIIDSPTEVNLNYRGDEDEIVQTIDGGNIALALRGSRFFSYNVSSEGLFGIKSDMKFGNLDVTAILGKDEAKRSTQKYTGSAQADSTVINSRSYVPRTHYYFHDPYELYQIYTEAEVNAENLPTSWAGNAKKTDASGRWIVNAEFLPDPQEPIYIYFDDGVGTGLQATTEGIEIGNPDVVYNFEILLEGVDYTIDYDAGFIRFNNSIERRHTIGAVYTSRAGMKIGNESADPVEVKLLRKSNQTVDDTQYWKLQMRNIYSLGMSNIQNEGFSLNVYNENEDRTPNFYVPDDVEDPTAVGMMYTDYLRLDSNQDGKIDGYDNTVDLAGGHIIYPFLRPFDDLGDSAIYEKDINNIYSDDWRMMMSVRGQIGREQISLGQMNILPGSVEIHIGPSKRKLTEKVDYIVDYDFGVINFLDEEAKDPDTEIEITYQFRPLFAMDSRTIMGFRADMNFNPNVRLGGTFIYQSETVKEERPRVGSENRSIIMSDIDGQMEFRLPFLTNLANAIPLVRTDSESKVTLFGEAAMSIPNIYGSKYQEDRKEAYIDDMEMVVDSYPLGISRTSWVPGSKPYNTHLIKARPNWWNAQNIYARDVYDPSTLTEREQREKVSALTVKMIPPDLSTPGTTNRYWAGLMRYVGNELDFSQKEYIEVLIKVDTLSVDPAPITMHIDLGDISEDFYTDFGGKGVLNTEDANRNGVLDIGEDIGLNMRSGGYPHEIYSADRKYVEYDIGGETVVHEEYPFINGTQGNGKLDTEDLNANGRLDLTNIYLEYSLSLQEDQFLESEYNGWRLYRIPLHKSDNYRRVSDTPGRNANLDKISFARVWFEIEDLAKVHIVNFDLVGNKWEDAKVRDENQTVVGPERGRVNVGVTDNLKDPHYTPAPGTVYQREGVDTRDQSLYLDFSNLNVGYSGMVKQRFMDAFNLLGYNKIRFWVYGEKPRDAAQGEDLEKMAVIRLAADSLTYYEIRHPIKIHDYNLAGMEEDNWYSIEFDFSDLTYIKSIENDPDKVYQKGDTFYYDKDDYTFGMRYRNTPPTLSNVREIWLGIVNEDEEDASAFTGRVYFNDIRVADPYEDIGFGTQASFNLTIADLTNLDISAEWTSTNFQTSASRTQRPSYTDKTQFNINNRWFLHKFFPGHWGLNMPLTLRRDYSYGIPRFKANSDVLRETLTEEEKEREYSENLTYRADVSLRQTKKPENKILAYTLSSMSVSSNVEQRFNRTPTNADTTMSYGGKYTYDLTFPKESLAINLFPNYQFYAFPNVINNSLTYRADFPNRWRWETRQDTTGWVWNEQQSQEAQTLSTESYIKYDILTDIASSYKLNTTRDLLREGELLGLPLGHETKRNQEITLDYTPKYYEDVFSLSSNARITYNEDQVYLTQSDSLYYRGRVNRDITNRLTIKNKDMISRLVNKLSPKELEREEQRAAQPAAPQAMQQHPLYEDIIRQLEDPSLSPEEEEELHIMLENIERQVQEEEPEDPERKEEPEDPDKKEEPREPTKRRPNIFVSMLRFVGRLDNITINYNNRYNTSYDYREERPEFWYQLGIPNILTDEELTLRSISDRISTSAALPILNNLTTNWSYSYEITKRYGHTSRQTITTTFPSVSVSLTGFEKIIRAERFLNSSRLNSSLSVTNIDEGDIGWDEPQIEQTRLNLTPVLSWHANWANDITSTIAANHTQSRRVAHNPTYDVVSKTLNQSLNSSISYSFSAPTGWDIPLLGNIAFANKMTADLSFNLERTYNTTKGQQDTMVDVDRIKYSIKPTASYEFSRSIDAGLTSSYDWNRDRRSGITTSTFRLGVFIEITF
jgi:hypothetical protein